MESNKSVLRILDLARWAPSGDNTQPWRFEIRSTDHFVVHGSDTRDHCIYDFNGRPSQIALGALLENIHVAASTEGLEAVVELRPSTDERKPTLDVRLRSKHSVGYDSLAEAIPVRAVQRRPLSRRSLSASEVQALENAVGPDYRVEWLSGSRRTTVAQLLWSSARLRLTMPEAYEVHRAVIAWRSQFSNDRVPDQAIGLDPVGTLMMRWVMKSWSRVAFVNNYLGGTLLPRLQLDLLPGLMCAAHFAIVAHTTATDVAGHISAGRAVQRFWLTATKLGLQLQPEMTPLIFTWYAQRGSDFSVRPGALADARIIANAFGRLLGTEVSRSTIFFGRIGHGRPAKARSLRLPLETLLLAPNS